MSIKYMFICYSIYTLKLAIYLYSNVIKAAIISASNCVL